MVVVEITGIGKVSPSNIQFELVGESYQCTIPVVELAEICALSEPQMAGAGVILEIAPMIIFVLADNFNVGSPGMPPYSMQ